MDASLTDLAISINSEIKKRGYLTEFTEKDFQIYKDGAPCIKVKIWPGLSWSNHLILTFPIKFLKTYCKLVTQRRVDFEYLNPEFPDNLYKAIDEEIKIRRGKY